MYSGKDVSELVGYTSRVYSLIAALHALDSGEHLEQDVRVIQESKQTEQVRPYDLLRDSTSSPGVAQPRYLLSNVQGKVTVGADCIRFDKVPIVAPAGGIAGAERGGEVLLTELTLQVAAGEHVLVTGAK